MKNNYKCGDRLDRIAFQHPNLSSGQHPIYFNSRENLISVLSLWLLVAHTVLRDTCRPIRDKSFILPWYNPPNSSPQKIVSVEPRLHLRTNKCSQYQTRLSDYLCVCVCVPALEVAITQHGACCKHTHIHTRADHRCCCVPRPE